MAYLSSPKFVLDCGMLGVDPHALGKLVVELLDHTPEDRAAEVSRIKRMLQK
jgi:hypothetical protein